MVEKARFRGRSFAALLLLAAALATSLASGVPPVAQAARDCVITEQLVNPCRPWLGGNAGKYPSAPADARSQITAHEARIGRQLDVVHLYHVPGTRPMSADDLFYVNRPATIASITWKPATDWSTADGSDAAVNAQIDAAADDIKALGTTKIMLTLYHEPEDNVSGGADCTTFKGTDGTTDEYRAMWRNVHDRFAAKQVTNVVFVMNYMGAAQWDCMVEELWPGDDLVDWVMWDPYTAAVPWSQTIGRFYDYLTSNDGETHGYLSKPWGLAEWGVWKQATQAFTYQYYDDARASIAANEFPRLKLYSIFDNAASGTPGTTRIAYDSSGDWDQVEVDHYRALANDPALVGTGIEPPVPDTQAPTAPTALATTHVSTARVTLQWDAAIDDVGVASYLVFRDGAGVGQQMVGTTFDDSTVQADATYTYLVQAVDAAGNVGAASDPLVVETPPPPPPPPDDIDAPSAPTAVSAAEATHTRVTLQWTAATDDVGVASYDVLRNGSLLASGLTGTGFLDTPVQAETQYTYQVRALDAAGNIGPLSDDLVVQTPAAPDTTPPTVPTLLRTTENTLSRVTLAWNASTDNVGVVSYRVSRNGIQLSGSPSGTTFADINVQASTSYTYRVQAVDAAGNASPNTPDLLVTTPAPPDTTAPTVPTSLRTTSNTSTAVALAWNAASDNVGVVSYRLFRNDVAIGGAITGTTYADTTVAASTSYTYQVQAVDAAGNVGPLTANLAVTTPAPPDTTAPTAPTNLTGTAGSRRVTLRWNASTDNVRVTGYYVYRGTTRVATTSNLSATVTGLRSRTTYTFSVRAFDAAGNISGSSATVSVRAN